jgi:Flp pilus assembly protein TadD
LAGKGDFPRAAAHFEKALSIYPDYLVARNDLGAQYLKLKRLDEAERLFQFVLGRDPKNFNAKFNLGLVRVERQDYLNAMAQLRQAMALDPTRPVARLWLGFALLETGDVMGAERELTTALVMGGLECSAANYHLARIYLSRGDVAEADRSIRVYLKESPRGEYAEDARRLLPQIQEQLKPRPRK